MSLESPNKVFVHIGLPKTATSTLQSDFFPQLEGRDINYLGVRQPRTQDQKHAYKAVYHAVSTGLDIKDAKNSLAKEIKKGKNIVISEEMFIVSQDSTTWRIKLGRLKQVLEDCDYVIIVTVREPVKAMFSYFVELYPRFRKLNLPFGSLARNHESMEIFHYGKLIRELEANFCEGSMRFFSFEKIVNNELDELIREIVFCERKQQNILLGHHNSRRNYGGPVLRIQQHGLGSALRSWLGKMGLTTHFPDPVKGLLRLFRVLLDLLVFKKKFVVSQPSLTEMEQLRGELFAETRALERFGIYFND